MTRLTIAVPDELAAQIREAAEGSVSAWMAELARRALLREGAAAAAAYDRTSADTAWDAERERDWSVS